MRITHVAAPARYGGLEEVVYRLCTAQAAIGHRVCACFVLSDEGGLRPHPLIEQLRKSTVDVREIRPGHRGYVREARAVAEASRHFSAAVVHTHGYRADVVDGLYLLRRGLPVVSTIHGYTGGDWKNRLYESIQRRALRWFDGIVAVSSPLARSLIRSGVPERRVWTIPNAWTPRSEVLPRNEARRQLSVSDDDFVVGWVGRLSHEKGPDLVVDALSELQDPDTILALIGTGAMEAELRRRASAQGTSSRILWVGEVSPAAEVFSAFDVFVLSSRTEGTPMVLFEAVEAGIPIVATEVGGVGAMFTSDDALLVPPDDASEIAAAVDDVRRNPDRARARAAAASSRIRGHFGVEEWIRRYDLVYRSVLQ